MIIRNPDKLPKTAYLNSMNFLTKFFSKQKISVNNELFKFLNSNLLRFLKLFHSPKGHI